MVNSLCRLPAFTRAGRKSEACGLKKCNGKQTTPLNCETPCEPPSSTGEPAGPANQGRFFFGLYQRTNCLNRLVTMLHPRNFRTVLQILIEGQQTRHFLEYPSTLAAFFFNVLKLRPIGTRYAHRLRVHNIPIPRGQDNCVLPCEAFTGGFWLGLTTPFRSQNVRCYPPSGGRLVAI